MRKEEYLKNINLMYGPKVKKIFAEILKGNIAITTEGANALPLDVVEDLENTSEFPKITYANILSLVERTLKNKENVLKERIVAQNFTTEEVNYYFKNSSRLLFNLKTLDNKSYFEIHTTAFNEKRRLQIYEELGKRKIILENRLQELKINANWPLYERAYLKCLQDLRMVLEKMQKIEKGTFLNDEILLNNQEEQALYEEEILKALDLKKEAFSSEYLETPARKRLLKIMPHYVGSRVITYY